MVPDQVLNLKDYLEDIVYLGIDWDNPAGHCFVNTSTYLLRNRLRTKPQPMRESVKYKMKAYILIDIHLLMKDNFRELGVLLDGYKSGAIFPLLTT